MSSNVFEMRTCGSQLCDILLIICASSFIYAQPVDSQMDLVQPDETHLEGVPSFILQPEPLYYALKGHPAVVECIAEPVSHAVIQCPQRAVPYKGHGAIDGLVVTRLDSNNRPNLNGDRWHLKLAVRAKEVEEWFGSYTCRCEVWNKVVELQRPKKVVSTDARVVAACKY